MRSILLSTRRQRAADRLQRMGESLGLAMRRTVAFLFRVRAFLVRWTLRSLSFARLLSPSIHREWLRWLAEDMGATHPKLPEVLRDMRKLEGGVA